MQIDPTGRFSASEQGQINFQDFWVRNEKRTIGRINQNDLLLFTCGLVELPSVGQVNRHYGPIWVHLVHAVMPLVQPVHHSTTENRSLQRHLQGHS